MEEPPPLNKSKESVGMFRKSAFGRTNLFLNTTGTLFREIRRSSSAGARHASTSVFHTHMGNNAEKKPANCVCWHCCHPFDGEGMRLPRIFDPCEKIYHVYGWYCSPSCAKAYLLEHSTFDRGYQMNIFSRMIRDVYGVQEVIKEAPPRLSLKSFGGPFDIDSFRQQSSVCTLVTPPFVSYCMLIEERYPETVARSETKIHKQSNVRGLRRPPKNASREAEDTADELCAPVSDGMYASFLTRRQEVVTKAAQNSDSEPVAKRARKATSDQPAAAATGLARFACSKQT